MRRALAPFAVLEGWVDDGSRGCAFVNAFAELDRPDHPGRPVIDDEKRWLRELFARELERAGVADPDGLALQLLVVHEGALVTHAVAAEPAAPGRGRRSRGSWWSAAVAREA